MKNHKMASKDSTFYPANMFDADGFIQDPEMWDESVAVKMAKQDGLPELTPGHWNIIRTLRVHYENFGEALPAFRHVCFVNQMDKYCLDELFHSSREAWRIAGLPNPGEEAKSYM